LKSSATTPRSLIPALPAALALALGLVLGPAIRAGAQLPPSEERLRILTDPTDVKKKAEKDKEKTRPPIELSLSQIAPFDVLPYVKAGHWSTLSLELRANYEDYVGFLQTAPVPLVGLAQEIIYRRDARLAKSQRMRLGMQMLLPQIPKPPRPEISVELIRAGAVRPDEAWPAIVHTLEPHQMLVVILSKESTGTYAAWNRYQALFPQSVERDDVTSFEKLRYYRLVLPLNPEKPPLSPHPLTWTTISHVIWDDLPPETLSPSQQQAMLDWLHWGGQISLMGGAGSAFSVLKDSFLGPYLPAEASGENALLSREALTPLSNAYPPLRMPSRAESDDENARARPNPESPYRGYLPPVPINAPRGRPVFLAGLIPKLGSVGIPLGDPGNRLVGVERRVGRGRVLMLALDPTDPALAVWPGLDTFIRRVILRRPEEDPIVANRGTRRRHAIEASRRGPLYGTDLTWVRYLSRDLDTSLTETTDPGPETEPTLDVLIDRAGAVPPPGSEEITADRAPERHVAEWVDTRGLPRLSRELLEEASGIKIPSALFVLKLVLAYILTLVPVNWLVCRYLIGRREMAWVLVPILSLGFAVGVERAAAYDVGFNSACDEIDVVEIYGGYSRAHVTRFSSLYSTGRTRFTLSYPSDPTALALPLDTGRTLRGEDVSTTVWHSYPVPALEGYLVQPRSLGMVRSEGMEPLEGTITLETTDRAPCVVNRSGFELTDAVLVDVGGTKARRETYLGTIPSGGVAVVKEVPRVTTAPVSNQALRPQRYLRALRVSHEERPENQGELRLVAWVPQPLGGQKIVPTVDRHRGFTAIVAHLRNGPPPAPDGPTYNRVHVEPDASPPVVEEGFRRGAIAPRVPPPQARPPGL